MLGVHRRRSRSRRGVFVLTIAGPGGLGRKLRRGGQESTRDVLGDEEGGTVGGSHCRRSHGSGSSSSSSSGSSSGNSCMAVLYIVVVVVRTGLVYISLYIRKSPTRPTKADENVGVNTYRGDNPVTNSNSRRR